MKDNGKKILCMAKEHIVGRAENMLVNIIMDRNMAKVYITGNLILIILDNGFMASKMEREF